ncbi:MAG: phospholipase D-like domain-containing protein [Candidatus Saccharimonadales bacterium]
MSLFKRSYGFDETGLTTSQLYDQAKFCDAFTRDLSRARTRVLIESPFITMKRLNVLLPTLRRLHSKGVDIVVNTKPLEEHDQLLCEQAFEAVGTLQDMGVTVLMTIGHHRKLAIIDDDILWEGSLNILSQNDSCELMRRINSPILTGQMLRFIGADKWRMVV